MQSYLCCFCGDTSGKQINDCCCCTHSTKIAQNLVLLEQGLVFGVGTDKGVIKLFDVRSYAQGPFDAFTVSSRLVLHQDWSGKT